MNGQRVKVGISPGLTTCWGAACLQGVSVPSSVHSQVPERQHFPSILSGRGFKAGERVIYISLEEREDRLILYMKQKDWEVEPYLNKSLYILKLDPTDFNLANNRIKNELPNLINEINTTRVVIDPISLFEDLFGSDAERRREMFRFIEGLRDKKCTIMMTSETDQNNAFSDRHGLIEYFSDTVILLRYVRSSDLTDVHLALEVVKMRMSAHSREIKPYEIEQTQVTVYSEANVF